MPGQGDLPWLRYDTGMTRRSWRARADFPLAAIAAYGPDDTRATKVVVSILRGPEDSPHVMRTWSSETTDIRSDPVIAAEIAEFVSSRRARRTVKPDRVIGCPHEEGIDYPMGRTCPQCPFWARIDRFTNEPARPPEPTMSAEDVSPGAGRRHAGGDPRSVANEPCPCGSGKKYKKCCGR